MVKRAKEIRVAPYTIIASGKSRTFDSFHIYLA